MGAHDTRDGQAKRTDRFETRVVHAGERRIEGALTTPVFQSATYEFRESDASYHDVRYIRLNNTPNHAALSEKMASLEGSEAAMVTASGMAAISAALLASLEAGDHVLIQDTVYGGTHTFVHDDLPKYGITATKIDPVDPASWKAALRPETRVLYVESISNPTLVVPELRALADFAREHGLVSMIDNTFATPVFFRPVPFGFDLVLHSGSKYLNGHSDIVCGAAAGSASLVEGVAHRLAHLGGTLDPHACFLMQRGLKTLALRVRRQADNALALARFLEGRAGVSRVHYPGLESSPGHARANEYLAGHGGMVSFELDGGLDAANACLAKLRIPMVGPSLGGVETLVTLPATTSHAGIDPEERRAAGIADGLVRVSVGIEDPDDLVEDFDRALP